MIPKLRKNITVAILPQEDKWRMERFGEEWKALKENFRVASAIASTSMVACMTFGALTHHRSYSTVSHTDSKRIECNAEYKDT